MSHSPIVTRNPYWQWIVSLAACAAVTLFMFAYHDWWRAKPYSWGTLNETSAQGAIFGLCVALALGPLARFFPRLFENLVGLRRTFGVSAALFAALHVLIALIPLWNKFGWKYITENPLMVSLGFCAAAIMLVMATISFNGMPARMGAERWIKIQKLGYLAVVLACAHFLVLGKVSGWQEWFRTHNHPMPPGSLPVCVVAAIPLLLRGLELIVKPAPVQAVE